MARRRAAPTAAALTSAIVLATATLTAAAPAAARPKDTPASAPAPAVAPDMLAALQRDLRLTPDQARVRLANEERAARTEPTLRARLGTSFGGAWLSPGAGTLVVAVTNAAQADLVRGAGAQPKLVARSARQLDAARAKLDRKARSAPAGIPGWYVDAPSNTVVVLAAPGREGAAAGFAAASGADAKAIRVVTSAEAPRPLFDIRGGTAYFINNQFRCSIGFSVAGGFVTAGHCGSVGATTAGFNGAAQGTVRGSRFPGDGDYGWVQVNANWTPRPWVNNGGANLTVAGSQEAATGSSVCRSGSTSGWHCGTILSKNATANYPQGAVTGLTRTNACAEGGDSGGSWLTGNQAQGVTSGGSGNCTSGGITFFQPVNEILGVFGLQLTTSGSPTPPPPPPNPTPPPPPNPPPGGSWAPNTFYPLNAQVTYAGGTYRCRQAHTSQVGWEPPNVPALWLRV